MMVLRVMGHERASTTLDLYTRRTANTDRILAALSDEADDQADDQADDPDGPEDGPDDDGGAGAPVPV